jgi:heme/copper-type cytochrome/quinol oxidase subunit 1
MRAATACSSDEGTAFRLRRHVVSTGHKVIGLQYAFTRLLFLLVGFSLVLDL